LFVDLALNPLEQLDQAAAALREDLRIHSVQVPPALQDWLGFRRAA
jgi:hypothetical protein